MYDNITKLYKLENINSKIESLDTTIDGEVLTLHLKLLKDNISCPLCQTYPMYFHGFRLKKLIHSVSLEHQVKSLIMQGVIGVKHVIKQSMKQIHLIKLTNVLV